MLNALLRALRVFVRSLLGWDRPGDAVPELPPVVPSLSERLGFPFPLPAVEVASPLSTTATLARIRSTVGPDGIVTDEGATAVGVGNRPVAVRIRLAGALKLPGPLQRQRVSGSVTPSPRGSSVALVLDRPSPLAALLSTVLFAAFLAFVFLTWIAGPADISLVVTGALALVLGALAGGPLHGILNHRAHTKERRRLAIAAARLATLLDGRVTAWP